MIESISAITLATHDMARAVNFYRVLGFEVVHGGDNAAFTSFRAGANYLNLIAQPPQRRWSWWGRVIFFESDLDGFYGRVIAAGLKPETAPRDAEWGERFFHLIDPDGHELSFAWPLGSRYRVRVRRRENQRRWRSPRSRFSEDRGSSSAIWRRSL